MDRVEIVTQRDIIRGAAKRFRESYGSDLDSVSWKGDKTRRDILNELEALDADTASAAQVDEIIGNNSWTGFNCDLCGEPQTLIIRAGDEPDYEARWLDICPKCVCGMAKLVETAAA